MGSIQRNHMLSWPQVPSSSSKGLQVIRKGLFRWTDPLEAVLGQAPGMDSNSKEHWPTAPLEASDPRLALLAVARLSPILRIRQKKAWRRREGVFAWASQCCDIAKGDGFKEGSGWPYSGPTDLKCSHTACGI